MTNDLGPIYTKGRSYRARAEARQREYRAGTLNVGCGQYGHFLTRDAAGAGRNFILEESFVAAQQREQAGKGVAPRTFENMLSSQAMCFNIFAPLRSRLGLAGELLGEHIPGLKQVDAIHIEYTPAADVFRDQSGRGGVDCDVLLEGRTDDGNRMVLVIETKFVEPEFSVCGFRKAGREKKGQEVCPTDVPVGGDRSACLYVRNKRYGYWQRTDEHGFLADSALTSTGCPFGAGSWQLWVNLALAHEEAKRRGAAEVRFAVCTSRHNTTLLRDGQALDSFRSLLRRPETVQLIDLEEILESIAARVPPELASWADGLAARYGAI